MIAGFAVGGLAGIGGGGTQGSAEGYVEGLGLQHNVMLTKNHLPESQTVEYNTVPGTSGDHWARWSECGFFEEELPDERVVHNLEHGNIVVSYNFTDSARIDELRDVFDDIGLSNVHGVARAYRQIPEGRCGPDRLGCFRPDDRDRRRPHPGILRDLRRPARARRKHPVPEQRRDALTGPL